jgi:hypothetical protein
MLPTKAQRLKARDLLTASLERSSILWTLSARAVVYRVYSPAPSRSAAPEALRSSSPINAQVARLMPLRVVFVEEVQFCFAWNRDGLDAVGQLQGALVISRIRGPHRKAGTVGIAAPGEVHPVR